MSGGAIPTAEQDRRAPDLTPGLRGDHRGLNTPRGFITGGQAANAATRPEYRGHAGQAASRQKAAGAKGKRPCPAYRGGSGSRELHFPPSGAETVALTLLTGLPLSPGSQRSKTAKGQRQQKQRPSPAYREVAQRKASQGAPKAPAMLLRDRALLTGRSLCPERLSRAPFLQPDAAPLLALASPFRTTPLLASVPAAAKEGGRS